MVVYKKSNTMVKLINPKYRHPETGKEGEEKKET